MYDLAVSPAEVTLNQSIVHRTFRAVQSNETTDKSRLETAHAVAHDLAAAAGMAGVKAHQSRMGALTDKTAEEITAYLSQYFAKQGWISSDKVKIPKFARAIGSVLSRKLKIPRTSDPPPQYDQRSPADVDLLFERVRARAFLLSRIRRIHDYRPAPPKIP